MLLRAAGVAIALVFSAPAMAQQSPMTPIERPEEPDAIPLGTGGVEGSVAAESWYLQYGNPFARNVADATLTPFLPDPDKATGAAVIVAPGGGFLTLSMKGEGWAIAEALAEEGVAAFVLKYRVRPTPESLEGFQESIGALMATVNQPNDSFTGSENMIEDGRAAFALIRKNADEWGVDPDRIGMIGFSAGARVTLVTALGAPETEPAFIGRIYGSMDPVDVPADAPPLFAAVASDDGLFGNKGFALIKAWQDAGRPVEFHFYQNGGHGFGLGNAGTTSTGWFDAFMHWLDVNGFLEASE